MYMKEQVEQRFIYCGGQTHSQSAKVQFEGGVLGYKFLHISLIKSVSSDKMSKLWFSTFAMQAKASFK